MVLAFALLFPILSSLLIGLFRNARRTVLLSCSLIWQTLSSALFMFIAFSPAKGLSLFRISGQIEFSLYSDATAKLLLSLVAVGGLLVAICAAASAERGRYGACFFALLFLSESAAAAAALSSGLIPMLVCSELFALFSFLLAFGGRKHETSRSARKYLFYLLIGICLALFGTSILSDQSETLSFVRGGIGLNASPAVLIACFCIVLGCSAKVGLYPLHGWFSSLHTHISAPIGIYFSIFPVSICILTIIRSLYFIASPALFRESRVQVVLLILALLTALISSVLSCNEKILKKRLAYVALTQTSYTLIGLFLFTESGVRGALLQIVFFTVARTVILISIDSIILLAGVRETSSLYGIGRKMPVCTIACAVAILSLIGFPPTGGFLAIWTLSTAALGSLTSPLAYVVPAILLLSSLFCAISLLLIPLRAFSPTSTIPTSLAGNAPKKEPVPLALFLFLLAAFVAIGGLLLQSPLNGAFDILVSTIL